MTARRLTRTYRLGWPRSLDVAAVAGFVESLAAEAGNGPVMFDTIGQDGAIEHYLTVPASRAGSVIRRLSIAVPGVRATDNEGALPTVVRALQLRLSSRRRALRADRPQDVSTAIVSALAGTRRG